jgi:Ran GTPase-activating protein (RanGAP) involved in mRNA processing and transport
VPELTRSLRTNKTLTSLKLGRNKLRDEEAAHIAEMLIANTGLLSLDIDGNIIGADGACRIAESLAVNTTLTSLDLVDNRMGTAGTTAICNAIEDNGTLKRLVLTLSGATGAGGDLSALAAALRVNSTLAELRLWVDNVSVGGGGGGGSSGDRSADGGPADRLEEGVAAFFSALEVNRGLAVLFLADGALGRGGPLLTAAIGRVLEVNSTLTSIDLAELAEPAESPDIDGCQALRPITKALCESNTSLTSLTLGGCEIRASGARLLGEALTANQSLRTLSLWDNRAEHPAEVGLAIGAALAANPTALRSLDLEGCRIGDAGARAIGTTLSVNRALTTVNLNSNELGDAGAASIAEGLQDNRVVQTLLLESNRIGLAGARAISQALLVDQGCCTAGGGSGSTRTGSAEGRGSSSMTCLDLSSNDDIGDEGAACIAAALRGSQTLRVLDITGISMGSAGAAAICDALAVNTSLTKLSAGCNRLGNAGEVSFAAALQGNQTLLDLDLRSCQIGAEGMARFAEVMSGPMAANSTLFTLGLSFNASIDGQEGCTTTGHDAAAAVKVPLTAAQRVMFLWAHSSEAAGCPRIRRLPLDIVRRILTLYWVAQGQRRLVPQKGRKLNVFRTVAFGEEVAI